jgi:hypothetical protein
VQAPQAELSRSGRLPRLDVFAVDAVPELDVALVHEPSLVAFST